ncbi:AvaI/BsoBI family type II restriction endonuclease, partial [Duncaniella muris]|uniref:AvaI/BsoBI family type II restriction endonuclease n=1 Tax=Duncaniella muris TaxID=2094150 RepID=UPI0034E46F99
MNPLLIIRSAQELITSRTQTRSGFIEAALAKNKKGAQAESTVHMLNWAIRSV